MVRFCDKEIFCIREDEADRGGLIQYFLNGHLDDLVCILDEYGRYVGAISYMNLIRMENVGDAISDDYVVWGMDIWRNARRFFATHKPGFEEYILLPVVDKERHLLCFAYEDSDANRELRMLRELQEGTYKLQFADIYSDCQCVNIHGFNELAYFFAKYLSMQGIPVKVEGEMWEIFFKSDERQFLDYSSMDIYAEGTWKKSEDWIENLLRTVSVEFECIDQIYEANLKAGFIKDADWGNEELADYLRKTDGVIIKGTDAAAQDACDYFSKIGIEVCCFAEWRCGSRSRRLLGRPVMEVSEAVVEYGEAVFVDSHVKGSAWGMGETDYFDYMGYRRNKGYFLLGDYMEIQRDGLRSVLKGRNIVLAGDVLLCERLAEYLEKSAILFRDAWEYIALPEEQRLRGNTRLRDANIEEMGVDTLCLIVLPEYFEENRKKKILEKKEKLICYLREVGIVDYSDYFSYMVAFINIEKEINCKYQLKILRPKRVVVGFINACCGSIFFRGLLDSHPSIVMMANYDELNGNLFWFCVRLSGRNADEISSLFLQLYNLEWEGKRLENLDAFMEKMRQLLSKEKNTYTSQELFVIFHIAYMYMYGRNITDMTEMMIYWEPHYIIGESGEECTEWLGVKEVPCDIINIVRNLYMRNGSNLKYFLEQIWSGGGSSLYQIAIAEGFINRKLYDNCRRTVARFEDIKCRPQEELRRICKEWEIPWSETLLHTSCCGEELSYDNGVKRIRDFDLTPVYHTYEEYFSELDRLKISLLCRMWQKEYGYPYGDIFLYSKRELQEMFLKDFRFTERLHFSTRRAKVIYNINFQNYVRARLQNLRMFCILEEMS